jgi:AcrR family transcriptional regulator
MSTGVDKFRRAHASCGMTKASITRDKLLFHGRALLWRYGYSNVSLRRIAQAAGVDVALVSRYFGSKRGLFDATLQGAFDVPPLTDAHSVVEIVVQLFITHPRDPEQPSILHLLQMNAQDSEVGAAVRSALDAQLQSRIEIALGCPARAALLTAVIMGMSVAEKSLHLSGIAPCDTPAYEAQLRHMLQAALSFQC